MEVMVMYAAGYLSHATSKDGSTKTVQIRDSFDFNLQKDFRKACHDKVYNQYIIDLGQATYMDSAALGILMVLHRHVNENRNAVRIINCNDAILDILRIAHFNQFFDIPQIS